MHPFPTTRSNPFKAMAERKATLHLGKIGLLVAFPFILSLGPLLAGTSYLPHFTTKNGQWRTQISLHNRFFLPCGESHQPPHDFKGVIHVEEAPLECDVPAPNGVTAFRFGDDHNTEVVERMGLTINAIRPLCE